MTPSPAVRSLYTQSCTQAGWSARSAFFTPSPLMTSAVATPALLGEDQPSHVNWKRIAGVATALSVSLAGWAGIALLARHFLK